MTIPLILACPVCTYERVMPSWALFAVIRLIIIGAVSIKRFDLVRILGVFAIYEVVYYYLWRLAVWYSHPAVSEGIHEIIALGFLLFISFGIPVALILLQANKSEYLKGNTTMKFSKRRAFIVIGSFACLAIYQGL